jgi:hypothetical protein
MYVRRSSFSDHILPGGMTGQLIDNPHSAKKLGAEC